MSKTKELEADIKRYVIPSKKEWRTLSANNLYDMYMDKKKGSNEFSLHAKGTMKIKTPPPPVEPPGDIQKTLDLILQKLNQHDQFFAEIKTDIKNTNQRIDETKDEVKSEIKNVNVRVDEVKTEVNEIKNDINKRFDEVKSEIKNVNVRVDEVKTEVNEIKNDINKRIDTIVELNNLKTDVTRK